MAELIFVVWISQAIWMVVAQWCNPHLIFAFNINDLLDLNIYANGSIKYKKGLHVVYLTTFWCVWKAWNVAVFVQVPCSVQKNVEDINALSFIWVWHMSRQPNKGFGMDLNSTTGS
ncbi:hypothetical protein Hdeb2414_s0028g00702711 [Helianthus debilis subsp. tardiflorus]